VLRTPVPLPSRTGATELPRVRVAGPTRHGRMAIAVPVPVPSSVVCVSCLREIDMPTDAATFVLSCPPDDDIMSRFIHK
jgi:hypothetical protein